MKRKLLACLCLFFLLAPALLARHRHFGFRGGFHGGFRHAPALPGGFQTALPHFRTYGSRHGFGNIVFPGMGHAPPLHSFGVARPSFFLPRYGGLVYPFVAPVVVPATFPVHPPAPPLIVIFQAPSAREEPTAPVVINQNFARAPAQPVVREQPRVEQQVPDGGPAGVALIVLKDSSVYLAEDYRVEAGTLHYVTPAGHRNQVSLDLIDRSLTEQLNRESRTSFRLPPENE